MCGLVGYALDDPRGQPDADRLRSMTSSLSHRGPDDESLLVRAPFALGFRRLSIIDVEGGRQPILSADGKVAVAGNGEIYNFRELRARLEAAGHVFRTGSDIETILHLYLEHGEDLVHELVGMFAFCVLDWRDAERPRVLLGRDRLGVKPLYWAETPAVGDGPGALWWASEPKALLAGGATPREMRREALLDYLVSGYCGGPHSAWSGIQRLPPAHTLTWTPGSRPLVRRYWDLPTDQLREPAQNAEVLEWLDRVVRERLVSEVPLGAFLSGGIDSSSVVESMTRASREAPVACSVGFEERSHDELDVARRSAARWGAVHHTQVLRPDPALVVDVLPWFFDEPHADPSTVPTYLVSRTAREHVTVALSGDGGDEVFAGYRRYVHDLAENRVRRALGPPGRALAAALGGLYPQLDWAPRCLRAKTFLSNVGRESALAYWNSVSQLGRDEALRLLHPELAAALSHHDPFHAFEEHYRRPTIDCPLYRAQYADLHTNLPDRILAKVDRASMASSLEVRVPLLDHRFVERFAPLPASEKIAAGRGKHRLREALRPRLPGEVLDGRKRGFDTPLAVWIRGPLKSAVHETVSTLPEEWFDRRVLQRVLAQHVCGYRDHSRLLWSLLVLEHWRRRHGVTGLAA
ncbi:MAG: asparagine synthase (glutamine-hydrolyzing) [Planctomycetota bacterium]